MAQVSYGTITITDTNDIESIIVEYNRNQSTSSPPNQNDSGWSTNRPAWAQGYYIWQRTRIHKSGTQTSEDDFGTAVCLTGSTGNTGATGQSLIATKTQYTNVASNITITTSNHNSYTWTDNVPAYNSGKPVYWARITNTYANPSKTEYLIYKDQGTTDAIKTSYDANTTAGEAKEQAEIAEGKANTAIGTANTANTNANNALNIATGLNQHFWIEESDYATGIPAGVYVTDIESDTFKSQKTGGNLLTRSDGIWIRDGIKTLASLTGSSFVFYRPTTTTTQGSKGVELTSTALKFYNPSNDTISMMDLTSTELIFKTSAGTEIGKFGSDSSGGLLNLSGRLDIRGGGRIGQDSDNYWEFGDNKSYNSEDSAYLIGKGTASIQLGETGHWRLDSNRIHSGWYQLSDSTAGTLHFDTGVEGNTTYYWDYGLHYPNKSGNGNNKFLYIRRSSDSTSTSLATMKGRVDDDDFWVYKFYVDGDGNIHAGDIYSHDTLISGTSAPYLLKSGGTITGNLEVNGTLTKGGKNVTYLTETSTNGQILIADGNGSGIKTSGYTIATSVPSGAVFTDYRVKTEARGSTTMYLAGSNTSETVSQGTLLTDSGVYIQTSSSSTNLVVPKVNGYTLAAASAKGVDTSIAAASTSTNLPTSKAVAAFVEGKGYKTTDNNTTYSLTQDSSDGHKITLTPSSGNAQTVTIPDNNTTYTFANGTNGFTVTPSGGDAQTVTVTPSISNNITGTGTRTSGYLAKFSGTNTITNGPALGTGTTKFLREDGTWVVPGGTYSLPTASSSTLGGVKVGSGLSISDEVLSHADTSSQASSSNSGRTYIQSITLDTYGHVTALSTATETVTNTHNTAYLYAGKSDGTANAATTNGNTYLILMDGGSATTRRKISGSGTVSVASDANGNITVTGSAHPTSLKNPNALAIKIYNGTSTSSNTNYDGSTANQSVSVAGVGAITSIGISGSTLSWTKADGTTGSSTVTITASVASGSKILTDTDGNALNVGSTNKPIYFSGGVPVTLKDGTNDLTIGKSVPSDAKFTDTWTAMVGATSSANGSVGYVNAVPPKDGYNTKFLRADGTWVVPGGTYSLPLATNGTRGGVQIGYTQSGKNYPVQLSSEKMYVNVPWENTWRGIQNNLTSDSTTDSLSAAQGKTLANGSARDNTKLPLSGGTMTGQIKTDAGSGTWLSAATSAALYSTVTSGYNAITSQATKNGRITIGTYPSSDDKWYLTYFLNTRTENGNDGQLSWTPSTNTLSTNISGNAATATTASWANLLKPIATTTAASASTWNIPSGSKQVWGERFSDSTLTYTPSGGSATTITDTGDWVMWLTPNATSNAATLNMRIDGTYYGSFSGNLSGNASTATTAISLNGGTALSSKNLNDYHDTSGKLNYYYAGGSNNCTNVPVGNGIQFGMMTYNSAAGHVTQELSSFSSATNKGKWIRWYQSSTWTDWEKFLTSVNYSDYTVTKTGTGASGTWGISISGSAAKLGTSNVGAADRPIYLSAGSPSQTTYRMAATNATATSALSIDTNLDTGIWYVNGTNSTNLYSVSDGAAYVNKYSDSWIAQIYQDYRTGQIALRGKNNGTWQAWRKVLDSSNYTNYLGSVYVKTTGNEGVLGTKVFGSGTSYGSVTNNTTYTEKANINYNSTLEAIVFSFA